jgi:hypothetical protein
MKMQDRNSNLPTPIEQVLSFQRVGRDSVYGGNVLKKPRIGIAGNIFTMESGPFTGIERAYVNDSYIQAVERAGGVPILLPVVNH